MNKVTADMAFYTGMYFHISDTSFSTGKIEMCTFRPIQQFTGNWMWRGDVLSPQENGWKKIISTLNVDGCERTEEHKLLIVTSVSTNVRYSPPQIEVSWFNITNMIEGNSSELAAQLLKEKAAKFQIQKCIWSVSSYACNWNGIKIWGHFIHWYIDEFWGFLRWTTIKNIFFCMHVKLASTL